MTKNKKGDDIEYLVFKPPLYADKIKVFMMQSSNVKCIRLELFGCSNNWTQKEYQSKSKIYVFS